MAALRASGSSTNLPAYCPANCVPDDSPQMPRSKSWIGFQSAFEVSDDTAEEDGSDGFVHHPEKKRRLTVEQVNFLEKSFELENKLEPERKIQIANELGLQPRQVAVWFQNRRARWKTKKLEKDYDILKTDYTCLKGKYDVLLKEKGKIEAEMMFLKERLQLANRQTKGLREEQLKSVELNGVFTLVSQPLEEDLCERKLQLDTSLEDQSVGPPLTEKEGSSMSDTLDASEISNTSSPRYLQSKLVSNITHDSAATARSTGTATATCFLISNLNNSTTKATSLPPLFSESLLKKMQTASIKLEPEINMHCETACCNLIVETEEEGDIPWWDWDYYNFCT